MARIKRLPAPGRVAYTGSPWARLRWPGLLVLFTLAWGVLGFTFMEGWSFVDALYMTLLTLTTVGLQPPRPLDASGQLLAASLMVLGVSVLLVTLSLVAAAIRDGGLGEHGRRRKMKRRIASMRNHYIICAYGRVGRTVARELKAEGVPFVVIDKDEELEERMMSDGVPYMIDDPTHEEVLRDAGVEQARGLICALDSDAENVFISLAARSLNPEIKIVARASEASATDRLYRAGADRVVSPYVTSGRQMALAILRPHVLDYFYLEREASSLRLEDVRVEPGSELVARRLGDVVGKALALAVRREGGEIVPNPSPDYRLAAGDLLVLLGEVEALRQVEE